MINDPDAEVLARVPPEPEEPWRVRPRRRNRQRSPRRRWMAPLISAVLASLGTIAILQPGNASGPWSPRPSHTASTGNEMHRSSPSPDAQPLISKRPESAGGAHHRPRHDAELSAPARKAPAQTSAASNEQHPPSLRSPSRNSQDRSAPRHHRSRAHGPQRPRRAPAWVRTECSRRFPHDATRRTACIAAVRNYLSR